MKITKTKSGMTIVSFKAFGFYANFSFGRAAKPVELPHYDKALVASRVATEKSKLKFGRGMANETPAAQAFWLKEYHRALRAA